MSGFRQTQPAGPAIRGDMDLDAVRCYRAMEARDRRFDGRFFTAVRTTGIYCRPICPAPTPKARNVVFYPCAAAAEEAGFRPCLRCRPETAPGTPAWNGTSAVVARALRLIESGALDDGDAAGLAARLGLGERQLRRLFEQHLGAAPAQVARSRRVHFARRLLDETDLAVTQVAFAAGFGSIRQFNDAVRATFQASPTQLRARRRHDPAPGELTVRLPYRPPLPWATMLSFLAGRATPGVEVVADGVYRRTARIENEPAAIEVRPDPEASQVVLHIRAADHTRLIDVVDRVRRVFDLGADPLRIATHLRRDPRLRSVVTKLAGLRVPGAWDPFELAVRAILGQQVSVRAATTLAGRLADRFGTVVDLGPGLARLFPEPATLADAPLETIGLPRARATTIRTLADAVASKRVVLDASDGAEAMAARLCALPGIGPWTAEYVAMRALGEPDAFPAGDLGVRGALGNGGGPVSATEAQTIAEAWRPWRAYAVMYLWHSHA
jgi:AraC family transcriptional regulator, regulatory protein of adaptative response / DNA-3-methyladenine glycosylase II